MLIVLVVTFAPNLCGGGWVGGRCGTKDKKQKVSSYIAHILSPGLLRTLCNLLPDTFVQSNIVLTSPGSVHAYCN